MYLLMYLFFVFSHVFARINTEVLLDSGTMYLSQCIYFCEIHVFARDKYMHEYIGKYIAEYIGGYMYKYVQIHA